ncbi:MAG TPA: DUF3662 and FHA domain-containing protein [Chloroflexota bacterium]
MNALARFEGFMQELMDRRVVRLLGGNLQPVELAQAIGRAMADGASGTLAPNRYRLLLQPHDCADLRSLDDALERKLAEYAVELARERGLNFAAPPEVQLVADGEVERGCVRALTLPSPAAAGEGRGEGPRRGREGQRKASSAPMYFEVPTADGCTELPIDHFPFAIGRRPGNDLVLPDPRASRDHACIEQLDGSFRVRDLASRNGTLLNGQPIDEADLRDGDRLAIGAFEVTVRIPWRGSHD